MCWWWCDVQISVKWCVSGQKNIYAATSKIWQLRHVIAPLHLCSLLAVSLLESRGLPVWWQQTLTVSTKSTSNLSLNNFLLSSPVPLCLSSSALQWGTVIVCLLSLCTLILFMDRLTLRGGWVCFQFSPLPCPEKRHFQNQTNKSQKMR